MMTWFTDFFRGPGRFNDILAIVWHVIVKFLCWREQRALRPSLAWEQRVTWDLERQPQVHTAEYNNTEGIKIEEYDMHVCIQITRSGQDRDTESPWNGQKPPSHIEHNVWIWILMWRLWNENQILYKDNYSLTSSLSPVTSIVLSSRCPYDPQAFVRTGYWRSGGQDKTKTLHNPEIDSKYFYRSISFPIALPHSASGKFVGLIHFNSLSCPG